MNVLFKAFYLLIPLHINIWYWNPPIEGHLDSESLCSNFGSKSISLDISSLSKLYSNTRVAYIELERDGQLVSSLPLNTKPSWILGKQ